MKFFSFIVLILFSLISCAQDLEKDELGSQLIGTWKTKSMIIQMNSFRNGDSTAYFIVNEDIWEETMNIKPIITNLSKDGKYFSRYYDLQGKLMRETEGTWTVSQDSMIFIENGLRTAYHTYIQDSLARFRAIIDWDRDGESDDLYEGIQIKVK